MSQTSSPYYGNENTASTHGTTMLHSCPSYRDRLVDNEHRSLRERIDMVLSATSDPQFDRFMNCYKRCVSEAEFRVKLHPNDLVDFLYFKSGITRALEALDPSFDLEYIKFMSTLRVELVGLEKRIKEKIEILANKEFLLKTAALVGPKLDTSPGFMRFLEGIIEYDQRRLSSIADQDFLSLLLEFKKRYYFRDRMIDMLALEKNKSKNLMFLLLDKGFHYGTWFIDPLGEAYQTCEIIHRRSENETISVTNKVIYRSQLNYSRIDCEYRPVRIEGEVNLNILDYIVLSVVQTHFTFDEDGRYRIVRQLTLDPSKFSVYERNQSWDPLEYWDLTTNDFKMQQDVTT